MTKVITFSELDEDLFSQYKVAVQNAFPKIILCSKVIENYWDRVESYFPECQLFLIDDSNQLLGFVNSLPLHWDRPLSTLPDQGWDWMLEKGISDYENAILPNTLGGLQIIVTKDHRGKGYSKVLISEAKATVAKLGFAHFVIPIRPTFKDRFPNMKMTDYIQKQENGKTYDPWIRTHMKSGAEIIRVCAKAMRIDGDIEFWKGLTDQNIEEEGDYIISGALNPVRIDPRNNYGVYFEDNIWIRYLTEI